MSDTVPGTPKYDNQPRKYSADPDVLNKIGRHELSSYMQLIHHKAQQLASTIANTKRGEYYNVTLSRDSPQADFGVSFVSVNKNATSGTPKPKKRKSQRFAARLLIQDLDVGPDVVLKCTRMSPQMSAGIFSPPLAEANPDQHIDINDEYADNSSSVFSLTSSPSGAYEYAPYDASAGSLSPAKNGGDAEDQQLHTGTLSKRAIKSAKNWTKRYFVLYPQKLCYFKGKSAKKPTGTYHLCAATEVSVIIDLSLNHTPWSELVSGMFRGLGFALRSRKKTWVTCDQTSANFVHHDLII